MRRSSLFSFVAAAAFISSAGASSLSLSELETISEINFSAECYAAYNTDVQYCPTSAEVMVAKNCTQTCMVNIMLFEEAVQDACEGAFAGMWSLLRKIQDNGMLAAICPNAEDLPETWADGLNNSTVSSTSTLSTGATATDVDPSETYYGTLVMSSVSFATTAAAETTTSSIAISSATATTVTADASFSGVLTFATSAIRGYSSMSSLVIDLTTEATATTTSTTASDTPLVTHQTGLVIDLSPTPTPSGDTSVLAKSQITSSALAVATGIARPSTVSSANSAFAELSAISNAQATSSAAVEVQGDNASAKTKAGLGSWLLVAAVIVGSVLR